MSDIYKHRLKRIEWLQNKNKKEEDELYSQLNKETSKNIANEMQLTHTTVNRLKQKHNFSQTSSLVEQQTYQEAAANISFGLGNIQQNISIGEQSNFLHFNKIY